MDNKGVGGRGTQKGTSNYFSIMEHFCGWRSGLSPCVLCGSGRACILVDCATTSKDFVKWCIISFMSDMQFKIYSIFQSVWAELMDFVNHYCVGVHTVILYTEIKK